jgi:F420-dependent oxidoreductase-like protein
MVYVLAMVSYAIKTPPQHGTWADFLSVWRAADDIDIFESAWTMDHFYPLTPPIEGPHLESWAVLAAMAQATKRLRLGCMVNGMHYRHPAVTANAAATLDHISGGRFSLGLGAGWYEVESSAYGIELGTLRERFDRLDEGLEVIVSLLTNELTTFKGRYFQLLDARCEPKPVQRKLPIVIGGSGPTRTLRAAARWADHWDMVGASSPSAWARANEVLLGHCASLGRDPTEILRSVHVMWPATEDPAELADRAAAFAEVGVDLVIFSMRGPYEPRLLEPLASALKR